MTDHTPSQAEGEPDKADTPNRTGTPTPDHPTPSQAEGERDDETDTEADTDGGS
ncbi:hypothetical protein [Streptomyces phaeoluteigriseus]|uniref:hypothetical protein n=1 Tax=Streptomyces phaeoluteigriseus TaxID=114686 RepID=UPI001476043E|nr:hypothetical protein [Streptomyces phaeoluteigriseus]